MDLWSLLEKAAVEIPPSRVKDIKTAVRTLGKALGYTDPHTCPAEAYMLPLPTIYRLIETHLAEKGPHTIRNVKNNLSVMFRTTQARKLLTLPATTPKRKFLGRIPRKVTPPQQYHLHFTAWPRELQTAFTQFTSWATTPVVEGRPAQWRKRPVTVKKYLSYCEAFFGYLANIRTIHELSFNQLFDAQLVSDFVHWHINEQHGRVTRRIHDFLTCLLALTRQYHPDQVLHAQIKDLQRTLPRPDRRFDKGDNWVSLAEIEAIGKALWPSKPPQDLRHNGILTAVRAGLSVMLQLWVKRPYRQRNIREMQLDKNLYRKDGRWIIGFTGEELKIARKQGKPNTHVLAFPENLTPTLEAYLRDWRPILAQQSNTQRHNVFLNRYGRAYTKDGLWQTIREVIYKYTGKALHPHLIRSIWATEYISATGDYYGAAAALNNTQAVIIANYSHLREEGIAEKIDRWAQSTSRAGSSILPSPPLPPC